MAKLEVICGPMFAGKTEELIRRIKRCVWAEQKVQVFKHTMDIRFGVENITSHGKTDLEIATGVKPVLIDEEHRILIRDDTEVVAFDEAQFFEENWLLPIVEGLVGDELRVICAGLDIDCHGKPFGCVPALLALADEVTKIRGVCKVCKRDATRTYRETPFPPGKSLEVGGVGIYEPRCLKCWKPTPR